MDLSIIIPLFNEAESLPPLYDWIKRVMDENKFSYEIIFINDGSTDDSWKVINDLKSKDDCVKAIRFRRNYGKSPAVLKRHKAMLLSQWMPIYKILLTKFRNSSE